MGMRSDFGLTLVGRTYIVWQGTQRAHLWILPRDLKESKICVHRGSHGVDGVNHQRHARCVKRKGSVAGESGLLPSEHLERSCFRHVARHNGNVHARLFKHVASLQNARPPTAASRPRPDVLEKGLSVDARERLPNGGEQRRVHSMQQSFHIVF